MKEKLYKTARIAIDPHLHTQFKKGDVVAVEHYREFGDAHQYLVAETREGLKAAREDCVIFHQEYLSDFVL